MSEPKAFDFPQLFNIDTRLPEALTGKALDEAVINGTHAFKADARVPVISPEGDAGTVPADKVKEALSSGFKVEDPEARRQRLYLQENKGFKGTAKVAVGGALDEALFGVPEALAEGVAGKDSQGTRDWEALKEHHAAANVGGRIVGGVGSMFVGGPLFKGAEAAGHAAEGLVAGKDAVEAARALKVTKEAVAAAKPLEPAAAAEQAVQGLAKRAAAASKVDPEAAKAAVAAAEEHLKNQQEIKVEFRKALRTALGLPEDATSDEVDFAIENANSGRIDKAYLHMHEGSVPNVPEGGRVRASRLPTEAPVEEVVAREPSPLPSSEGAPALETGDFPKAEPPPSEWDQKRISDFFNDIRPKGEGPDKEAWERARKDAIKAYEDRLIASMDARDRRLYHPMRLQMREEFAREYAGNSKGSDYEAALAYWDGIPSSDDAFGLVKRDVPSRLGIGMPEEPGSFGSPSIREGAEVPFNGPLSADSSNVALDLTKHRMPVPHRSLTTAEELEAWAAKGRGVEPTLPAVERPEGLKEWAEVQKELPFRRTMLAESRPPAAGVRTGETMVSPGEVRAPEPGTAVVDDLADRPTGVHDPEQVAEVAKQLDAAHAEQGKKVVDQLLKDFVEDNDMGYLKSPKGSSGVNWSDIPTGSGKVPNTADLAMMQAAAMKGGPKFNLGMEMRGLVTQYENYYRELANEAEARWPEFVKAHPNMADVPEAQRFYLTHTRKEIADKVGEIGARSWDVVNPALQRPAGFGGFNKVLNADRATMAAAVEKATGVPVHGLSDEAVTQLYKAKQALDKEAEAAAEFRRLRQADFDAGAKAMAKEGLVPPKPSLVRNARTVAANIANYAVQGAVLSAPQSAAYMFTGDPEQAAEAIAYGALAGAGLGGLTAMLDAGIRRGAGTMARYLDKAELAGKAALPRGVEGPQLPTNLLADFSKGNATMVLGAADVPAAQRFTQLGAMPKGGTMVSAGHKAGSEAFDQVIDKVVRKGIVDVGHKVGKLVGFGVGAAAGHHFGELMAFAGAKVGEEAGKWVEDWARGVLKRWKAEGKYVTWSDFWKKVAADPHPMRLGTFMAAQGTSVVQQRLATIPVMLTAMGSRRLVHRRVQPTPSAEQFHQDAELLAQLAADPGHMAQLTGRLHGVIAHDDATEQVALKAQGRMMNALTWLHGQAPRQPAVDVPFSSYAWNPSPQQLRSFYDKLGILYDPMSVLDRFKDGTLSNDHVLALNAMYPTIASAIQSVVMQTAARGKHAPKLPYETRVLLSMLSGVSLDPTLKPQHVQSLQAVFQLPSPLPAQGGTPGMPKKGTRVKDMPSPATDLQRVIGGSKR